MTIFVKELSVPFVIREAGAVWRAWQAWLIDVTELVGRSASVEP